MSNPFRLAAAVAHTEGEHVAGRRHTTEGRIIHRLLKHVYESGYLLTLSHEGKNLLIKCQPNVGKQTQLMPITGQAEIVLYSPDETPLGSIWLKFGQTGGNDLINAYSPSLIDWLAPVLAYARRA